MFGSRLKTWMENYIGRPRKKDGPKEKVKGNDGGGVIVESSESLACSDTGISFTSQQVFSSSTTDNREGYSTTTMESEKSGMTHCPTTVSLPSPESAYSTGYSTDGASPGETGPPEYYINIRTGKHYFPSPAPTPTSPHPNAAFLHVHSPDQSLSTSFPPKGSDPGSLPPTDGEAFAAKSRVRTMSRCNGFSPQLDSFSADLRKSSQLQNTLSTSVPYYFDTLNHSKSPCKKTSPISQLTPLKLFLKSPKNEKENSKADLGKTQMSANNKKLNSTGKPKKWFKQPFQKFGHRRTDSCDGVVARNESKKEAPPEKNFRYFLAQETSASPRQRNRIKTNPWLPTEPASSQNFHNLGFGFSPSLTRNRSCSNTPLQNRKSDLMDFVESRPRQGHGKVEEHKDFANKSEKTANRQTGGEVSMEASDHSEEDLTLNEVMGTYNESYVYEKETDILSDSDPTDCEDYGTDSEAANGGDERDSHDDELDFIDNGSLFECDDDFPQNTGKCTYHDVHFKKHSFLRKSDRRKFRKESECRKNLRKDQDSKLRRDKRREKVRKSFKREDEERTKYFDEKANGKPEENSGTRLSLSRVLAQRMLERKASRSVEGTPVTERRQKLARELRETHIGHEEANAGEKKPGTAREVILIDFEADHKYNELMKEAESILESLRNSPANIKRKEILSLPRKADRSPGSANSSKKDSEEPATLARKNLKELGLRLSAETPKKPKRLDLEKSERSSLKTRTSAHSPLDPLGPGLRNFAVFAPALRDVRKVSTSSSEDSESGNAAGKKGRSGRRGGFPESPVVPVAFQSVDLGKAPAPYCPQSEPVKRKIYSCSKTYDKLVKKFENKSGVLEGAKSGKARSPDFGTRGRDAAMRPDLESCLHGNQGLFFQRERRKTREKTLGEEFLHRPGIKCSGPEKPQTRSFDSDIFR